MLTAMPIKYYLQPNPVTPDPNDQSARVLPNASLTLEDIIAKMMQRGTTVTESDTRAVLNLFFDVVSDEVADGNFVNLPLANIRVGISSVFTSITDSFDPLRHSIRATLSPGLLLSEKMQKVRLEKTLQPLPSPVILEFLNINTNTTNSVLTPGGIGQIVGEELNLIPITRKKAFSLSPPMAQKQKCKSSLPEPKANLCSAFQPCPLETIRSKCAAPIPKKTSFAKGFSRIP
jgi:hypothetical protein